MMWWWWWVGLNPYGSAVTRLRNLSRENKALYEKMEVLSKALAQVEEYSDAQELEIEKLTAQVKELQFMVRKENLND